LPVKAIFMGTPEFAVPSLEKMIAAGHEVTVVFTQPDRPKGRGQSPAASPVKIAAERLGIPLYQPERVRRPEVVEEIRSLQPEVMVVVGYGQIIPQAILDVPASGIINVHASLLPKYRGAAPIQWAIARGETRTGVTTMRIDAGLDTGDMLLKAETDIGEEETAEELSVRLAALGAELLGRTLAGLSTIKPEKQDHSQATLAPILRKEDGRIDWTQPAREIANRVRGFQPWPGCYTLWRGKRLAIWRARACAGSGKAGEIRGTQVGCGDGALELVEVQPEGKKRMTAEAFLRGHQVKDGEVL
jgi:methionyl-tRNA formyltransferase